MLPIRIQDARGAARDLYDPPRKRWFAAAFDTDNRSLGVVREALETRQRSGRWLAIASIAFAFIELALFLLFAWLVLVSAGAMLGGIVLAFIALAAAILLGQRRYRRGFHREEIARALIATGRCASCGYEMRGLNTEPDGCLVCPECGAAWRADRRRRDEHPRWEHPFPWTSRSLYDDRGWRGHPHFGLRASLIGELEGRRVTAFKASGWSGTISYIVGWLVYVSLGTGIIGPLVTSNGWYAMGIVGAVTLLFFQTALWATARTLRAERMRRALLANGHCPSCPEKLPREPENDGCLVCEGCGAAWLTP